MSNKVFEEAIADAKKLREVAEANAKKAVLEAVTPKIREFIESELLENKDSKLNSYGHSKVINYGLLFIILFNIHKVLFTLNSKNSHNFKNLKIIFFYLSFTTIALVLNKFLLLEKINLIIYYFFGILMIFSFHVVYNKIYNAN